MHRVASLLRSLALVAGLALAVASAHAEGAAFLSEFEDLPLMPGLTEQTDRGIVFDSPSGRIVEAVAFGAVNAEAVRDFYAATLPELGWEPVGDGSYRREAEALRLEISPEGSGVSVKFALSPVEAPPASR